MNKHYFKENLTHTVNSVDKNFKPNREILGKSGPLKNLLNMIDKAAKFPVPVLITGESGTGKELVAKTIHLKSAVQEGPFEAVNCCGFPDTLIDSALYGYEKGAFTGASHRNLGWFETANNGTLVLDEIGDMPLYAQTKLLRVLQEKEIVRLGSTTPLKINTRIIAATNKNLNDEIKIGKFRSDLYYRLAVFEIEVPSLRERKDDIPILVNHFIDKFSEQYGIEKKSIVTPDALSVLKKYPFPGNVRELENVILKILICSEGGRIDVDHLPGEVKSGMDQTTDIDTEVDGQKLYHALITITNEKGLFWANTLKNPGLLPLYGFLLETKGNPFTRQAFCNHLSDLDPQKRNKEKTATRFLNLLKENNILSRNLKKANQTRYKLNPVFLKP